ncbi:galactose-1-phosphate uridylyltransferase [Methanothrix soehngenii]|uniref:galactose-1-phosphate uridylyltransferase n=1 Tax=Methanothrix soehngenii TaxID=2223 RepID=UPI002FDFEE0C
MPEIRRHYFLEEYCIIAAERNKRPSDFLVAKAVPGDEKDCPFCPGHEDRTPPTIAAYTDDGILTQDKMGSELWQIRVFLNAYPTMIPRPEPPAAEWISLPGQGYHEVIVDSRDHRKNPRDFGKKHLEMLVSAYTDRYRHYSSHEDVKYITIFKNWGKESGASLSHSHSQLITLPFLPPQMKREEEAISRSSFCPYCNIVDRESASCRLINENDHWILFAPFYSLMPYETWILPKRHLGNLTDLRDEEQKSLASILAELLRILYSTLDDPPYNLMIFQLPKEYHFNIRIQPIVSRIAGFERSSGIYVNPVPPELAAAELRNFCLPPKD